MTTPFRSFALALGLLLLFAAPAAAASAGVYWKGFVEYWDGAFRRQNGVVMGVLVVGAIALFIITRGKWRK